MERILLVEDEDMIRELLEDLLSSSGYGVVSAATGDEAIGIIRSAADFGVVLTDVNMPGSADGIAVGREARRVRPGVRVVYITGRPDMFLKNGVPAGDRLVLKPFRLQAVMDAIDGLDDAA